MKRKWEQWKKTWKGIEARAWKSELKKRATKVKVVIAYTFATSSRLVLGSHRKQCNKHSNTQVTEVIIAAFCAVRNIKRIECRDCAIWLVQMQLRRKMAWTATCSKEGAKYLCEQWLLFVIFAWTYRTQKKLLYPLIKALWEDGCLNISRQSWQSLKIMIIEKKFFSTKKNHTNKTKSQQTKQQNQPPPHTHICTSFNLKKCIKSCNQLLCQNRHHVSPKQHYIFNQTRALHVTLTETLGSRDLNWSSVCKNIFKAESF